MSMLIVAAGIGYALGNVNFSFLVVKICKGIDIREYGSGNAGATNVNRILGPWAALTALAGDVLKGIVAVIIGRLLAGETGAIFAAIAVVAGHNWPFILGFKGGKGVATSLGVLFSLDYRIGLILLAMGVLVIAVTRYVSLASMVAAAVYPFLVIGFGASMQMRVFSVVISLFAIYRHRGNLKRLIKGEESKLGQKVKFEKEESKYE